MPIKTQSLTRKAKPKPLAESAVQAALMNRLQANGYFVIRHNGGAPPSGKTFFRAYTIQGVSTRQAHSGYPDVAAYKDGFVRLFEVKKVGGKISDLQSGFARLMQQRGGITVEVVTGIEGVEALEL